MDEQETLQEEIETPEEEVETPDEKVEEKSEEETPEEELEQKEEPEKPINPDDIEIQIRKTAAEEPIDYGDDIDPDDVKVISKVVEKQTASVKQKLQEAQDQAEIDSYLRNNPEMTKYKPVIEKYIKHPVYSQIPVKNIAAMVASDELMKIGAKKEREAQIKADSTKQVGTQVRKPQAGQKDWTRASRDEFEAQKRRVLGQRL